MKDKTHMGRAHKLTVHSKVIPGIEPRTFLLSSDDTKHYITMPYKNISTAAHAASHGNVTHSEQSAIYPPQHTSMTGSCPCNWVKGDSVLFLS